ncbi:hypothetical protein BGZ95_010372 [Linnemannia exigua]|uniref:Uncharacterized protein n=1 Tax=Linnemannia exigua TaxID=604196 RepID=A0AAD4DKE2_9FUNG|nr:hypothetical protein BGZ95_010372 [Linnemannia exigua]
MESILCTLYKDDVILDQDQNRSMDQGNLEEVTEEHMIEKDDEEAQDGMMEAQGTSSGHKGVVSSGPAGNVSSLKGESTTNNGLLQPNNEQGIPVGWIESLNHSLRRFSRFQGSASGVDTSNAELEGSSIPNLGSTPRFAGEGGGGGAGEGRGGRSRFSDKSTMTEKSQDGPQKLNPNGPKWPYRRYARRAVLNFAHPQASPQMLVRALECIGSRCSGQIQALDLHANEKMQDAGLETPEELNRLFGSGFSKLRYLRLQGGFVDNQLLYALLNNFYPSPPIQQSESVHGYLADGWSSFMESNLHFSSPMPNFEPCCLSQVFLGPGSVTDSAVEKLVDVAGKTLEVFTVTSCVDVSGGALASLLTKCPRLRVLGVHRSLARDRELLEGLGIPLESTIPGHQQYHQQMEQHQTTNLTDGQDCPPPIIRKPIVAPLERLELGTVKLTNIGITEILKATCSTLRFLVLETQHFSEGLLTNVIGPLGARLEGLHFDDPEQVQRLQQQMQGLGFSAGRRGSHLPRHQIVFGRSGRSFYSDPAHYYRSRSLSHYYYSPSFQPDLNRQGGVSGSTTADRQGAGQPDRSTKVSAWLGEITTDEWVAYGDCALWSSAASPAVSYDNGGAGGHSGGRFPQNRQYREPLHQIYHKPALAMGNAFIHGFNRQHRHHSVANWFLGDSDELLQRHQVTREMVDEVLEALPKLQTFTVMDLDFILERKGLYESQLLMRQDDVWVQSAGFRALQMFYLCLFLSTIYFSIFR